ncbi:MAG: hypothetical protein ABIC95_01780 [archaeon]
MSIDEKLASGKQEAQGAGGLEHKLTYGDVIKRTLLFGAGLATSYLAGSALFGPEIGGKMAGTGAIAGGINAVGRRVTKSFFPSIKTHTRNKSESFMGLIFGSLSYAYYFSVGTFMQAGNLAKAFTLYALHQVNNIGQMGYNDIVDRYSPFKLVKGLNPKYLFKKNLSDEEKKVSTYHIIGDFFSEYKKTIGIFAGIGLITSVASKYFLLTNVPSTVLKTLLPVAFGLVYKLIIDYIEISKRHYRPGSQPA